VADLKAEYLSWEWVLDRAFRKMPGYWIGQGYLEGWELADLEEGSKRKTSRRKL